MSPTPLHVLTSSKLRGVLALVVGPSGAGKDTLIEHARLQLANDPLFVFARRLITRDAMAGAEDHDSIDLANFESIERGGGFLLSWRAHGLAYGLPVSLATDLDLGKVVIANVSRSVIDKAKEGDRRVAILHVTASIPVLAERIAARGRETKEDIERRLDRVAQFPTGGVDIHEVRNEGAVADSVEIFMRALLRVAGR